MDRPTLISALLIACALSGCARRGTESAPVAAVEHIERYAQLPGLSSSPHSGLRGELALLAQERMTPLALDAQLHALRTPSDAKATGREALNEAIPAISRPLLKSQLDELYRSGPLALSPVQLEQARQALRRWADDRVRFLQALDACDAGLGLTMTDGILADLRFVEVLQLGCRLEALAAAESLAENEPDKAIVPLAAMLRAARILAGEWNVTTRVTAANLRADAFHVLDAVANHDRASPATHERLLALVTRETSDWPSDAGAWIGDRATGLIAYELVRDGFYLSLLDQAELQRLRDDGLIAATSNAVMRNLDADELYYLTAMRQIIDNCQLPYYQRAQILREVRSDLAAREKTADYPLVAGLLLLSDFETGHRLQAADLARATAWKLALETVTGRAPPSAPVNPLTGISLQSQVVAGRVHVQGALDAADGAVAITARPAVLQARRPGGP